MAVLTTTEANMLSVVRALLPGLIDPAAGVDTHTVRMYAWDRYRITYDQAHRGLRGLLDKGLVSKPKRGHWVLVEERGRS